VTVLAVSDIPSGASCNLDDGELQLSIPLECSGIKPDHPNFNRSSGWRFPS
jgi:hypothetical protein